MNSFIAIKNANLPAANVKHAVVSPQDSRVAAALNELKIETIPVSPCKTLLPVLSSHADMVLHHFGGKTVYTESSQTALREKLGEIGFEVAEQFAVLDSKYPKDVALNCCAVGDKLICNRKYAFPPLTTDKTIINTAQGYAKCSTIVVDENSIITDDTSVASSALKAGLDALLVRKGDVRLNGFDYGFIGGCCGKISRDTVAFCGDINTHSDCVQIRAFLRERGVFINTLFGGNLVDIGSIIPLTEVI